MLLKGKIVLVTGSTGGLGRAVTKLLNENDAKVLAFYKDEKTLQELEDFLGTPGQIESVKVNVVNEMEVQEAVRMVAERHGRIDVLLNIVGGYRGGTEVSGTSGSDWDFMMDINLKSCFFCCKAVLPYMMKQNYGKIVNVAARPAVEVRFRVKNGAYSVSKAGVKVLTETIAEEVKKYEINVNCVLPSTIDTTANRINMRQGDFSKWVKPEDIAKVILFLASDDSIAVSGASIPVYGKA